MMRCAINGLWAIFTILLLAGCGTVKYTIDDGREVNPVLLENIRLLGQGERLIRPAIARTADLKDPECDTQWELPISVASSYDWSENDRVAWVRALQVDERLTVIGAVPESGFVVGDKLTELNGYQRNDANKMLLELANLRDGGKPFWVKKSTGEKVQIKPYKVCRGYTRLAPPDNPVFQDFHWLISYHPLEIFRPDISPDEALWMVLWTQGLSETGGARMKTFHYSKKLLLTAIDLATLATGINGAAQAAKMAATQVSKSASEAATKAASEELARKVMESAAKNAADAAAKEYAQKVGQEVLKSTGKQLTTAVTGSMMSRAGNQLSAISWVATYVFDQADSWAFERMRKLGGQPVAGATLHRKLMDQSLVHNAFVLDEERIGSLTLTARKMMYDDMLTAAIRGVPLENFKLQLQDFNSVVTDISGQGEINLESESTSPQKALDIQQSMPLSTD